MSPITGQLAAPGYRLGVWHRLSGGDELRASDENPLLLQPSRPCRGAAHTLNVIDDGHALVWQEAVADAILAAEVQVAVYVPDARLRGIVASLQARGLTAPALTREEECIAYAAGFGAAGGRAVVLMQCSGLGNSLNALGSFAPYGIGLPLVLSMRGTLGETNPAQVAMGRATKPVLEALGIQHFSISSPEVAAARVAGMLELAFGTRAAAAVILEPELGGQRERG